MNNVSLIGRLTREPETSMGSNGQHVTRFSLAVNRISKNQEADYIGCTCFGTVATFVNNYIHKGYQIAVQGTIQTSSYQDRAGTKQYKTGVICNTVENLQPRPSSAQTTQPRTTDRPNLHINIDDADLPF